MARQDRIYARQRLEAMRHPLTRADRLVMPSIEIEGGVYVSLSINK